MIRENRTESTLMRQKMKNNILYRFFTWLFPCLARKKRVPRPCECPPTSNSNTTSNTNGMSNNENETRNKLPEEIKKAPVEFAYVYQLFVYRLSKHMGKQYECPPFPDLEKWLPGVRSFIKEQLKADK